MTLGIQKGKMRVVASIEARMNSDRLPGKVLSDIHCRPALSRLISRLKNSRMIDDVVLATTTKKNDDVLEEWAAKEGINCYRGSEDDVLGRVVAAHKYMETDLVVEVTGDSVLLDPEVIDLGIETYLANNCDVVSNTWKPSYPMGVDVQVFSLQILHDVSETVFDRPIREHVSLFFYENPDIYQIIHLKAPEKLHAPNFRFQLDYPEDLEFIRRIYSLMEPAYGDEFYTEQIINLLAKHPHLLDINRYCEEKALR